MMRCKVITCEHEDTAHRVVARALDGIAHLSLRCAWCELDCRDFTSDRITSVTLSTLRLSFKLKPLPARSTRLDVQPDTVIGG